MKKILVVEDNPINLELVTDILEAAGYDIIQAPTAEEGIEKSISEQPDLVLMDIRLPGMDGLSAAALLKKDPRTKHICIVALTAQAMKGDAERAIEAGCDAYVSKPIDTRELPKEVARFLGPAADNGSRSQ